MEKMHLYIVWEDKYHGDGCYIIAASMEKALERFNRLNSGLEPVIVEKLDDEDRILVVS